MRVLSWNLYHGRDFPPDPALFTWRSRLLKMTERNATHVQVNRPLLGEFASVLDGFDSARVAARIGEHDRSISTLEKLLSIPYEAPMASNPPITPALLRLDPMFEPLRKDPRFQKLIASPVPK